MAAGGIKILLKMPHQHLFKKKIVNFNYKKKKTKLKTIKSKSNAYEHNNTNLENQTQEHESNAKEIKKIKNMPTWNT